MAMSNLEFIYKEMLLDNGINSYDWAKSFATLEMLFSDEDLIFAELLFDSCSQDELEMVASGDYDNEIIPFLANITDTDEEFTLIQKILYELFDMI